MSRTLFRITLTFTALSLPAFAADYSVEVIDESPEDVSEQVAALLSPQGLHVEGPRRGMVVHLDFTDIGARLRDVMDNRISQTTIVRPDSGDDDLHGGSSRQ